ncbi:MAG TPA: D-glycerate dehydrogenase [Pirellulaceae bacterium]|nr:D-glycerate dehydrogenase [Pirellulaceae bacterium]
MSQRVLADTPLAPAIAKLLPAEIEIVPWESLAAEPDPSLTGIYTYGHPRVDAALLRRLPNAKVISNYGVGVDHIDLHAAQAAGVPVGNTPGILDGATADMGFALLLAAARRVVEGDRFARGPNFTVYDPCCLLGREVHHSTLGIVGMGRIGEQVARRARGFDMQLLYHNRTRKAEAEARLGVQYVTLDELLAQSDFVMLTCPLTDATRGLIGASQLARMKPTAILINIARGAVVDMNALTAALQQRQIYSAALDVTDPEPLPRDHPLLSLDNLTIVPHLGSATEQTRQTMAELSVTNLLRGLNGEPLIHRVS